MGKGIAGRKSRSLEIAFNSPEINNVMPDQAWFPGTQNITYLDTAAEGLPHRGLADALQAYARDKK